MKKILLICAMLFCIAIKAQTPSFQWAKQLGGTSVEVGYAVATDASGNVYTTGYFQGTADFDPGAGTFTLASNGGKDIFISKLNSSGNFVWARSIGGPSDDEGNSVMVDANGNVCITGSFSFTADFDPGVGTFNMTAGGGYDAFITKLDASGNFLWAKQFGSTGYDMGYSIVSDASGNVYTTGYFTGIVDFDPGVGTFTVLSAGNNDVFISKLDASGNFVFATKFGGPSTDLAYSMDLDAQGNIFTTGYFMGTSDFDPGAGVFNLTAVGAPGDIFISKLDAAGNFVWAKRFGAGSFDIGHSIATDAFGNVCTTGYFQGTVDFDPGPGTFTLGSAGALDIFISKLDAAGNFVWAKRIGSSWDDNAYGIAVDGAGSVYTTGHFQLNVDFDPGPGTFTLQCYNNPSDIFISKLNSAGNFVWAVRAGDAPADVGRAITVDNMGTVYSTGYFNSNVDFNPGVGTFTLNTFSNSDDIYVWKLGQCIIPAQPGTINIPASICAGAAGLYSVSPVWAATSYIWNLPAGWSGSGSSNTINAMPGSSGIFTVYASGCATSPSRTLNVTVNPLPNVSVNSGSICNGQSFVMFPSGAITYTVQGGNLTVSPTANASYTLIGTSSVGCVSTAAATCYVNVYPTPTISAVSSTNQLCAGENATLTASGGNASYTWNPGGIGTDIVISPTVNTTYTVTGANGWGCESSTTVTQTVINCPTSVLEFDHSNFEISMIPNPTSDRVRRRG